MEELEKYRTALTQRLDSRLAKVKPAQGSKGLRIAISQLMEAIQKAEK